MLAAAFASYIGSFGAAFRNRLWKETWLPDLLGRDIPMTTNVDPLWVLTSDSQTAVWQNEGKLNLSFVREEISSVRRIQVFQRIASLSRMERLFRIAIDGRC